MAACKKYLTVVNQGLEEGHENLWIVDLIGNSCLRPVPCFQLGFSAHRRSAWRCWEFCLRWVTWLPVTSLWFRFCRLQGGRLDVCFLGGQRGSFASELLQPPAVSDPQVFAGRLRRFIQAFQCLQTGLFPSNSTFKVGFLILLVFLRNDTPLTEIRVCEKT